MALLENGFPKLEKHLRQLVELNKNLEAAKVLARLGIFRSQGIREKIVQLLSPARLPAPNYLVHMDFWADNLLFFRNSDSDAYGGDRAGPSSSTFDSVDDISRDLENLLFQAGNLEPASQQRLECKILDWQMLSIGRPTHDVVLLLLTALPTEIRRTNTEALLEFYWHCFETIASNVFKLKLPFDYPCLREEFKKSQLLAVLQVIASADLVLESQSDSESKRLLDALLDLIDIEII